LPLLFNRPGKQHLRRQETAQQNQRPQKMTPFVFFIQHGKNYYIKNAPGEAQIPLLPASS
jgi:hypothetical protein